MNKKYFGAIIKWIFVLFPIMWIWGVHIMDASKILLIIFIISLLFPSVRRLYTEDFSLSSIQKKILYLFIFTYPVLIGLQQIVRVYVGGQGINFASHCQIIENVALKGGLFSTLIRGDDGVLTQYLYHHFNVFFYMPGFLCLTGIPGYMALSIFEVIIILFTMYSFKILLDYLGYSSEIKITFIVLLFCFYTLRHSYVWGVEDDFFALPFIPLSYLFYLKRKYWLVFFIILLSFLIKESLPLYGIAFGLMAIFDFKFIKKDIKFKNYFPFILLIIISVVFFSLYFFGQPYLLNKNFEHYHRLEKFSNFLNFSVIIDKFYYFILILLPFLFYPLWSKRGLLLSFTAFPFLGMSFVSNSMQNIADYYSMIPSMVFAVASIIILKEQKQEYTIKIPLWIPFALVLVAFLFGTWKPGLMIINSFKSNYITQKTLEPLPKNARIYSTESILPLITKFDNIFAFYEEDPCSKNFDFLIIRKNERNRIPDKCFETLQIDEKFKNLSEDLLIFTKKK